MQGDLPFVELGFGQDSLLQELEEELAHVFPRYLTALQSWLHPNTHKDVQLWAQAELVHALNGLLRETTANEKTFNTACDWIPWVIAAGPVITVNTEANLINTEMKEQMQSLSRNNQTMLYFQEKQRHLNR